MMETMALLADHTDHQRKDPQAASWVELWILVSTWCTISGWGLSSLGFLNRTGYTLSFFLFLAVLWFYRQPLGFYRHAFTSFRLHPFRTHRWLPKMWLLLAALVFVGGLLYHPSNYDYLSYRFTRLLHWSWEQKWHWIVTPNIRTNYAAPGFEWLMAPLFVFFQTDRLFFLINIVSFLLLPGLIFSVFYRLGLSKRISWWWMWVLPCGYCYSLQAGSLGNDLLSVIYALASFLFILKVGEPGAAPARYFFYSCLGLALATGCKASNMPLALPWLMAALLQWHYLVKIRPILLTGILFLVATVSFLPMALLNIHYTGRYTGDPQNEAHLELDSPLAGIVGNSIILAVDNLRPPVWPAQISLNDSVPAPLKGYLAHGYPRFEIAIDQVQMEESGGLGIGLMACLFAMIGLGIWARRIRPELVLSTKKMALPIFLGAWAALFVLMAKLGNEGVARMLTPYYPLLVASILAYLALDGRIIRFPVCRIFAGFAFSVALLLVIISPARPLFPTSWAIALITKIAPTRVDRMERVYGVYRTRYDAMKDMREIIPANEKIIGYVQSGDGLEATLWRPYGQRQIIDALPWQSLEQLKSEHLHLIIVEEAPLKYKYHTNIADLTKKWSATIFAKHEMTLRATMGAETWYVIALP